MSDPSDVPIHLPLDRVAIVVGDITRPPAELGVDAIVNAANESLLGGGGVDGAIHRAAGSRLLAHNRTLGGCPTGLAKITPAFDLEARGIRHIIHTVGPVWSASNSASAKLGNLREDVLLASCYQRSLDLAAAHACRAVAFPAISTGVYRFPRERAAQIAIGHVLGHLSTHDLPHTIVFCCFSRTDADVYQHTLDTRNDWMFNRRRM
jgi:O-acetyl-ADP-ribose deacetylase (regulator of RNase III)